MLKLKISTKVLIFFLVVAVMPLFVVTVVLVDTARSSLLNSATTRQQIVAANTAGNVDNYLGNKINTLVYQSRLISVDNFDQADNVNDLAVLIKQDPNLQQVSLLGADGNQQIVFNQSGQVNKLTNQSQSDAYKAVNYLSGQNFISSVTYSTTGQPQITIAVPILKSNLTKNLNNLPAANAGVYTTSSDIEGVLVANYNISDLWQSVLSTKIGQGGYAYVVDGLGNIVAHPSQVFLETHQNISSVPAVNEFINGQFKTEQTVSEKGLNVVSTPKKLALTNWAVIVEEPTSSIYSGTDSFVKFSTVIIISAILFTLMMSLIFRKQIVTPIKKLIKGAKSYESGDFDQFIVINTRDEFQELANTFNNMGKSIKKLVGDLKTKNIDLYDEQARLSSIIKSVTDGIIALNDKGQIITINPPAADLIDKAPDSLIGKSMIDLYRWSHEGKPVVPELDKPGTYTYNELVLTNSNTPVFVDLVVSIIDLKDSEVSAIITVHDLTKSRELDMMKLDFVAIAAHELRTPVTVIQGYLNLLENDSTSQLSIINIENLHKAIAGTNQLRDLINKLLNISRIDRGDMDMHFEKLDIVKLVADNVKQHETTASTRGQTVTFNANNNENIFVPGDVSSLTEVLNNLIGNALKYTGDGDTVKVNLSVNNDTVRVEVSDNGPGIPSEHRSKLFTKFYRVERSLVAGNRGTGLGLYMSKIIINLHQGKIDIMPYDGHGSTFYFELPVFNYEKHDKLLSKEKIKGGVHGWFKKRDDSRR